MKALTQAFLAALAMSAGAAHADTSFNVAATSDYRYRGISQTRLQPALQGGVDHVHAAGWYAGAWASTIKWIEDAGGDGKVELDLYAGARGELAAGLAWDVGVLRYLYAGNRLGAVAGFANADTTEVYGQLGYGPAYVKYSQATTNLFGFVDSKGSSYLDLGASIDAGRGVTLLLHAGRQHVAHNAAASYTDWKIGASRAWGHATFTLAMVGTNAGKQAYASPANGRFLGKSALQVSAGATF